MNPPKNSALIRAEGVGYRYQNHAESVDVLSGVDLAIYPGELVLLLGPSGSGKTTLLTLLAGLRRLSAGNIELVSGSLAKMSEGERASLRRGSVGFVFQSFFLFDALTALDNVAEILVMQGNPKNKARKRAAEILGDVGLGGRLSHHPNRLSAGQKQRVAIARAIAGNPSVIFADEPTAALDSATAAEIMTLLRRQVSATRCALIVTHDTRLSTWADRTLAIKDGRIEEHDVERYRKGSHDEIPTDSG